jgi:hypothetical protein
MIAWFMLSRLLLDLTQTADTVKAIAPHVLKQNQAIALQKKAPAIAQFGGRQAGWSLHLHRKIKITRLLLPAVDL